MFPLFIACFCSNSNLSFCAVQIPITKIHSVHPTCTSYTCSRIDLFQALHTSANMQEDGFLMICKCLWMHPTHWSISSQAFVHNNNPDKSLNRRHYTHQSDKNDNRIKKKLKKPRSIGPKRDAEASPGEAGRRRAVRMRGAEAHS